MENKETFPIAIKARLKHGILFEALEKRGWNQRQAADFLGIDQTTFGKWINMKKRPRKFSEELILKLFELTGKLIEELWPENVFTPEFLATPKILKAIRKVPAQLLASYGLVPALPAGPEEEVQRIERQEIVREALSGLPPEQRHVLEARFFDGLTIEETGKVLGVSHTRVGQIEARGLSKLRHPARSRKLRTVLP